MADNKEILVSVFMMTYNHEKYIAQALNSILTQKVTFAYELIIGEDCSTDRTREIILSYALKKPDLFKLILHEHNVGAIANQNAVLKVCMGKYIALCEGDDYWTDPLKLQKQVDFLEANPEYAAVGHQTKIIYENYPGKTELFFQFKKNTLTKKEIIYSNHFHTNAIVFRKDALMKYDLKSAKCLVDHALFILIVQSGNFWVFPEVMSVYRRHEYGAAGTSTPEKAYPAQIAWVTEVSKILGRHFFWGYHFLSSRVHFYYALNHPGIFNGGFHKRNYYFSIYAILTLLLYPRDMKTIFRLMTRLLRLSRKE